MKDKPQQEKIMDYYRSRTRGNQCEYCGHLFEDGEVIFTPEQVSLTGETTTRYFCGAKMNCLENYKLRQEAGF